MLWIDKLKGTGLKTRVMHPYDEFWDQRLGVGTFGYMPGEGDRESPTRRVHYNPTGYRRIFEIFKRLELDESCRFLDLGSGLGRAVFAAHWSGAAEAVGVEINETLFRDTLKNLDGYRRRDDRIRFHNAPAEEYSPETANVVYIFHAFGPATLQQVLENLEESLTAHPRRLRIVYENPVHADVIDARPAFQRFEHWKGREKKGSRYATTFWTT
ncbi:16S rRNA G966 N2-methylase RsmD [Rhodovulum iodosum]|uniref:16S rRNA G966 N2-methylase RsmD n=1 Tax=Rhodovulum iodosum TaxID=68291 RepID=A0ABV3XNH3_9RHOB|nr:class I SAM-dependent methyltransferase [Rhodovulum robiginosum]RSK34760.1 class I SAM-dependent methyltransferase [Rhodovulum robiginosum]